MKPGYSAFSVEVPVNDPKAMADFQEAMDALNTEHSAHVSAVAESLGIDTGAASDIVYLRGRSRWTQDAENELVRRAKAGEPAPNIMEWP